MVCVQSLVGEMCVHCGMEYYRGFFFPFLFLTFAFMTQALKLSDDLHLNEVDCVRLLVSANKEVDFCCSFTYVTTQTY